MGQGAELGTGVDPKLPLGATGAPLKHPSKQELAEKTQLQMSFRRLLKGKRCGSGRSYLRALILAPWTCQQPSGGYSTARVRAKMRGSKVRGDSHSRDHSAAAASRPKAQAQIPWLHLALRLPGRRRQRMGVRRPHFTPSREVTKRMDRWGREGTAGGWGWAPECT